MPAYCINEILRQPAKTSRRSVLISGPRDAVRELELILQEWADRHSGVTWLDMEGRGIGK